MLTRMQRWSKSLKNSTDVPSILLDWIRSFKSHLSLESYASRDSRDLREPFRRLKDLHCRLPRRVRGEEWARKEYRQGVMDSWGNINTRYVICTYTNDASICQTQTKLCSWWNLGKLNELTRLSSLIHRDMYKWRQYSGWRGVSRKEGKLRDLWTRL